MPFSERVAMLQCPLTSDLAHELFLTDKYLPAKCLQRAFENKHELSGWRAGLIASSLMLEVAQVRMAFQKMLAYAKAQNEAREARRKCEVCGSAEAEHEELGSMLLCGHSADGGSTCNRGYHQRCLDPPLDDDDIPLGEFYCPEHTQH